MQNLNPDTELFYMFDAPKEYQDKCYIMCNQKWVRLKEFREFFTKYKMEDFNDFTVIKNIHADYNLGIYIIHNSLVDFYMSTDDFRILFTVKDYNKAKKHNTSNSVYCMEEQYNRFKDSGKWGLHHSPYLYKDDKDFNLKTNWHIVTYKDKAVALVSKKDSRRYCYKIEDFYQKSESFKVSSFEEGIEYLKNFS